MVGQVKKLRKNILQAETVFYVTVTFNLQYNIIFGLRRQKKNLNIFKHF